MKRLPSHLAASLRALYEQPRTEMSLPPLRRVRPRAVSLPCSVWIHLRAQGAWVVLLSLILSSLYVAALWWVLSSIDWR